MFRPALGVGSQLAGRLGNNPCTSTFSLTPGASCNLGISFTPAVSGSNSASLQLTDNALNASPATQNINLSGTGLAAFTITPTPSTETVKRGILGGFILTLKIPGRLQGR